MCKYTNVVGLLYSHPPKYTAGSTGWQSSHSWFRNGEVATLAVAMSAAKIAATKGAPTQQGDDILALLLSSCKCRRHSRHTGGNQKARRDAARYVTRQERDFSRQSERA
mmetsp:Transcript_65741/g.96293  ORF Transcript_65741/g.96293 Transcript_65741/m.96293 type:complete len:109 (-) Transcript_65741:117-443(-)